MDAWNRHTAITLPADCRGIAFDGCFFYLTVPQECGITKLKRDFTTIGCFKTDKPYECICYDNTEKCFWVSEKRCSDIIYKLDCDMREIGLLRFKNYEGSCAPIIGLSYDCERDTLIVAYKNRVAEVTKKSGFTSVIRKACDETFMAVSSISPYYAVIRRDRKGQSLQILSRKGSKVTSVCLPDGYCIRDVLFYLCGKHCQDELEFMLLAVKDGRCRNVLLTVSICGVAICGCNYDVCHRPCGGGDEREKCVCDVIESVALVEASLAHILNAEGEKLQKAVAVAKSVDELLEINKSVTKTVNNIAQLEHTLYLKLDALNDLSKRRIYNNLEFI